MTFLDDAMKALAVAVIVWSLLSIAFPSRLAQANITALFFVTVAVVIALFTGATLLAANFLYPGALTSDGGTDFLVFLASSAALSALFMLLVEEPAVKVMKRFGVGRVWAEAVFAFVHGLATAMIFSVAARFAPGVELAAGAALAAGFIGAFGFYFIELVFVHSGSSDAEEAFMEYSFEDEEDLT